MPDRVPARNQWADRFGYSRAVKRGNLIEVAGTVGAGDNAYDQAHAALKTISSALEELGSSLNDVIRTTMFCVDVERNGDDAGRAHGEVFKDVMPVSALIGIPALIDPQYLVEIQATAVLEG